MLVSNTFTVEEKKEKNVWEYISQTQNFKTKWFSMTAMNSPFYEETNAPMLPHSSIRCVNLLMLSLSRQWFLNFELLPSIFRPYIYHYIKIFNQNFNFQNDILASMIHIYCYLNPGFAKTKIPEQTCQPLFWSILSRNKIIFTEWCSKAP